MVRNIHEDVAAHGRVVYGSHLQIDFLGARPPQPAPFAFEELALGGGGATTAVEVVVQRLLFVSNTTRRDAHERWAIARQSHPSECRDADAEIASSQLGGANVETRTRLAGGCYGKASCGHDRLVIG